MVRVQSKALKAGLHYFQVWTQCGHEPMRPVAGLSRGTEPLQMGSSRTVSVIFRISDLSFKTILLFGNRMSGQLKQNNQGVWSPDQEHHQNNLGS